MIKIPFIKVGVDADGRDILGPKSPLPDDTIRIDADENGWVVWQSGDKIPELTDTPVM